MVATTAFGMGVDASAMQLVVHFQLPLSVIDYYQQIGRAGRNGEKAHAVPLYGREDISLNQSILRSGDYSEDVQNQLEHRLHQMAKIAASEDCIMR